MKKFTTGLTYFIRVLAILLIGVNAFRIFKDYDFFFFLQRPAPLALMNSFILLFYGYLRALLRKCKIEISDLLYLLTSISMLLTFGLGMLFAFYQTVPHYDSFAHFINGALLTLVSLMVLSLLVKKETLAQLSPLFIVVFAFSFSSMLGVVWELVEYSLDSIFHANMQRYAEYIVIDGIPSIGEDLVGRAALHDTMIDIILNTLGGLVVCIILYFDLKREAPFITKMYIKRIKDEEPEIVN